MPHLFKVALLSADPEKQLPVTMWMHRSCVPLISMDHFRNIYWPTTKPILEELWKEGHQVLMYAEGNWDAHLETFRELPAGSIIYHVDRGDIFRAHRILGDRFALSGGFPNDLLTFGTAEEVREYCRKIIQGVAYDGGYIMDAGAIIQNDASVENVRALTEATREYGQY
jgi:uroporphyrinogen-III decarboxylase